MKIHHTFPPGATAGTYKIVRVERIGGRTVGDEGLVFHYERVADSAISEPRPADKADAADGAEPRIDPRCPCEMYRIEGFSECRCGVQGRN